jgi:GNAT superfamily N-acetyltransferase
VLILPGPWRLREADASDAAGLDALAAQCSDGGAVAFRVRQHAPPEVADEPDERSFTVVAERPGTPGLVGAARLRLGHTCYEGATQPYALLNALMVHPAHRRRGMAAALTRWRLARAAQDVQAGPQTLVLAHIQHGNAASAANAGRWATAQLPPAVAAPVPMRRRPPTRTPGLTLREAQPGDLDAVAAGARYHSAGRNFARAWSGAALARWLAHHPPALPKPPHHCRVALDESGRVVAGLTLREEALWRSYELVRVPPALRLADRLLGVLPRDGVLRNVVASHFWFSPGQQAAARALWEDTRWRWRERGSHLLVTLDERDPVRAVLGLRPWSPTTRLTTVLRANPAPLAERLFDPLL